MCFYRASAIFFLVSGLAACGVSNPPKMSAGHLSADTKNSEQEKPLAPPPPLVRAAPLPKPLAVQPIQETYTVVVHRVPVDELLFALARDAELNIDIAGPISGQITLNAIDQTLLQLLDRISLQAPLRYELTGNQLLIAADSPYLQTYKMNYLNMVRSSTGRVDLATQLGTVGSDGVAGGSGSNNSQTLVTNESYNYFWDTLITNVAAIIGIDNLVTDGRVVKGNTELIISRETGLLSVRATQRQHKEIQIYLDQVADSARRQVLIEATVVEITLSDTFQAGVDWTLLSKSGTVALSQSLTGSSLTSAPFFSGTYSETGSEIGDVTSTIKALETFGDVQVLSSPKIISLNNQTAILKVVDNRVYFTTKVEITPDADGPDRETFETELHTVPVGFVMNVTPFISEAEEVILNVRPTISRILRFVNDPNPSLALAGVESPIPEIQVREMESMLRVNSGQIAVIGGLMQDKVDKRISAVPLLSSLPLIGAAFTFQEDVVEKTELIVFLRPKVVRVADVNADLSDFLHYLPQERNKKELAQPAEN